MKKLFIAATLVFVLFSQTTQAQDPTTTPSPAITFHRAELGFRFMPTVSSVKMESSQGGIVSGQATLGYGVGGFIGFNYTKHIGYAIEILYNSVSQKFKDEGLDRVMKVKYVTVPLLMSLNTGKGNPVNLKIEFGPQLGFNIGTSMKTHGDTLQTVLSTKQSDIGIAFGSGLGFALNTARTIRLDIGYRGVYGNKIKTNSGYLGFALLF